MQQTVFAVKSEKKRTDYVFAGGVTKATYNTIGSADLFYLYRCSAFARRVRRVEMFSNNAVKIASGFAEPIVRNMVISRGR